MWQRGCFPTKTLAWPRRLYRMRDRCAVLRTLLQCVCTQRRNCIGQLSPFSEYAPTALRNKWKPAATIKLIHYRRLGAKPHESYASGDGPWLGCLGGWLIVLKQRERRSDGASSKAGVRECAWPGDP